jgi:hypothetical protein
VYARSPDAQACPAEEKLRRAVAARVGYDPFFAWARQTVVVQVWHEHDRYAARVQVVDETGIAHGTRTLLSERDSCDELFDAAALAISIALDASSMGTAPAPAPTSAPAPEATSTPPAEAVAEPSPEQAAAPRSVEKPVPAAERSSTKSGLAADAFLGAAAFASFGMTPFPELGVAAYAGLQEKAGSLAIELRADLGAGSQTGPTGGSVGAFLYSAALVPCVHTTPVFFCVLGTLGDLHVQSYDVSAPQSHWTAMAGLGARVGADWALSSTVSFRVGGDLVYEFIQPRLDLDGVTVWTVGPVATSLALGFVGRFL